MTNRIKRSLPEKIEVPRNFRFAGVAAGIKKSARRDLSVVVCDQPATSFGAFTQNLVRASSVDWNETHIGLSRAIVINSGNANACTGNQGIADTESMAGILAQRLDCPSEQVLVMSTGIIGELLPMDRVRDGIGSAVNDLKSGSDHVLEFADGILTTDTFPKIASVRFEVQGQEYSILGIAKGAGMIGPRMATMLCVLLTDFPLENCQSNAREFHGIIERTFNSISVDGHTSTSDQAILLSAGSESFPPRDKFFARLHEVCQELAKMIPSDGEGATHLISIEVSGELPEKDLKTIAKSVADSPLVKTAIFGADPNWGRIVSAAGYSGVRFDPLEITLKINGFLLFENGSPVTFDPQTVSQSIRDQFETSVCIHIGNGAAGGNDSVNTVRYWTSDLTYEYVKINAEYHT